MTGSGSSEERRTVRVVAFAGSLRAASYNRALLRAVQELAPSSMQIDIVELHDIPLYNGDVEAKGEPASVATFKLAIHDADAILIATPEYNHGVPGVLKNAIDWASRPLRDAGQSEGKKAAAPLGEKLAAIIGASPGMLGSARAQTQLRQAFNYTNTYAMQQPEVIVGRAKEKFDESGTLTDEETRKFLRTFLEKFYAWTVQRLTHPVRS